MKENSKQRNKIDGELTQKVKTCGISITIVKNENDTKTQNVQKARTAATCI